jgi:hypothetical protein
MEATMKRLLVLGLVLTASLTGQVEHAPTVAQCQADQRLWFSKIEDGNSTLTFDALANMEREMIACHDVDPPNARDYYNTSCSATAAMAARMSKFIQRHRLWSQFEAEDAAAKR